jgi:hypothetical protein
LFVVVVATMLFSLFTSSLVLGLCAWNHYETPEEWEPAMDVRKMLAVAVAFLEVLAAKTSTKIDDGLLSFCYALQKSETLLDWIQARFGAIPAGAEAVMNVSETDASLIAALDASPAMQEELRRRRPPVPDQPDTAQPLGVGTILTLIKLLPQLLALFRALQAALAAVGANGEQPTT